MQRPSLPTFAEKLHNCFGSISADFGVGVGEGEAVEQQLAQGPHLADLKQRQKDRDRGHLHYKVFCEEKVLSW